MLWMRSKNEKAVKTHRLPKIHKGYSNRPKVIPISYRYYWNHSLSFWWVSKGSDKVSVKDSFDAANRIKPILQHLFKKIMLKCLYVSFDVELMFTNISI